ncbi:hypothetical protein TREMEDRAFT_55800 [Tremella mesenterica DSM 1558]|uniref:uncharacterized protein n=1 Tax=Tremella mesenterica (strain ATCC 24925 / CBS 8224 / DSM 1558 / NBRC 9311 / NRRL Y-6157 / RJB 2259-6 / UBC 559-6) TaxID=578456 RepID=UPI0003F49039|nr:uncharacterized protein TREMEDRAFT_55800 [Tremella mesenterica DSM 1558]EIW72031.1 hypothetical protein TREMEDRAFT_55800 [Tremella mesenterica DSM 1558]
MTSNSPDRSMDNDDGYHYMYDISIYDAVNGMSDHSQYANQLLSPGVENNEDTYITECHLVHGIPAILRRHQTHCRPRVTCWLSIRPASIRTNSILIFSNLLLPNRWKPPLFRRTPASR